MAAWSPPANGAITRSISSTTVPCSPIFRRTSEMPLYVVEKQPKLRARQGQYSVIAPGSHVLKRGHDLANVLRVFDRKLIKALAAE